MADLIENLDTTIAAAVKAQIEAKVLEALSGEEFFARYVHAALYAKVEVPHPNDRYKKIEISFIDNAITKVVREATKQAVAAAIEEQREQIQDAVRKAVKRQSDEFAEAVTSGLLENAKKGYGYTFDVKVGVRRGD